MSEPEQPPEMELIESLRKAIRPAMSVRKAAVSAGISEGRWRSLAKGTHQVSKGTAIPTRAPADTLARMARVVGATADQLRKAGREDASDELKVMLEKSRHFNEVRERVGEIYDDMQRRKAESNEASSTPASLPSAGDEPTIVHATRLLWNRIVTLADSPDGDPQRQDKADRVVIVAADVIADVLLGLNAGTPAKPLIEEMFTRATLAAQRRQSDTTKEGENRELEIAKEQAASSEASSHEKTDADSADDAKPSSAAAAADAITAAAVAELEVDGVDNNREQA